MPITATLSRRFYERLGDDIANELVEWLNTVDMSSRSELRELNETNFARFDARLDHRVAELRAEFRTDLGRLETRMDARFAQVDVRFAQLEGKFDVQFAQLDRRFSTFEATLVRWMFAFWTGTMIALAGFLYAMLHAR